MLSILIAAIAVLILVACSVWISHLAGRGRTQFGTTTGPFGVKETFRRLRRPAQPSSPGQDETGLSWHNSCGTLLFYDEDGTRVVRTETLPLLQEGQYLLIAREETSAVHSLEGRLCAATITVPDSVGCVWSTVSSPHCALVMKDGQVYLSELPDHPSKNHTYLQENGRWTAFQKLPLDRLFGRAINLGDLKITLEPPAPAFSGQDSGLPDQVMDAPRFY